MLPSITRPSLDEHPPHTLDYISLVPDSDTNADIEAHLVEGARQLAAFVRALPSGKLREPHAPGEWTVQDVLQHVIDTERVFAYRALCIARGETASLPGFDQDDFAAAAHANQRDIDDLLDEHAVVRAASLALARSLGDDTPANRGEADGRPLTVRAAIYIICGHERYHLASLQENYGA